MGKMRNVNRCLAEKSEEKGPLEKINPTEKDNMKMYL
jgi:hypothetical protein